MVGEQQWDELEIVAHRRSDVSAVEIPTYDKRIVASNFTATNRTKQIKLTNYFIFTRRCIHGNGRHFTYFFFSISSNPLSDTYIYALPNPRDFDEIFLVQTIILYIKDCGEAYRVVCI